MEECTFMKDGKTNVIFRESDSPIMQNSVPVKMLVSCFFSCILGIALMASLSHYMVMAVFICVTVCICITTPLLAMGKISVHTACLVPMLLLCFVYTPVSWFTFDGLLGATPYTSILFITIITLTHYRRIHVLVLSLYGVLLLGLTVHWMITWTGARDMEQIINILIAYILTALLNLFFIENIKRRNLEFSKRITDISMRDDLTGLLNRRAIEQILNNLERDFQKEGSEYAAVMLDADKFKSINDLYGHTLGDAVIQTMATAILRSIRPEDYAFRFGGDEFLLILPKGNKAVADEICVRIEAGLNKIQGYSFQLTMSKGFALRSEGSCAIDVVALADKRMYEDKRSQVTPEL